MKNFHILSLLTAAGLLASCDQQSAPAPEEGGEAGSGAPAAAEEMTVLYDGSSLDAFVMDTEGGWKIDEEGLLTPAVEKSKYIWTAEEYGDFVLELEFKMSENCNSGVFFRTDPANPVQGGFEIQVFDSHAKEVLDKHDCGALYDAKEPAVNAAKAPGEWNQLKLTVQGPKVVVVLNGQTTLDVSLDDWDTAGMNPDGTKNKFTTALKDLPRTGKIGLQEHGHPVWYRNIKIKAL